MSIKYGAALAAVCALISAPSWAQTDMASMAHLAAANQLGILEYCQSQGYVDESAVGAQQNLITHLPSSSVATGDAEQTGKAGTLLAPNGTQTPLAQLASSHNTTVAALCKQIGSTVAQANGAFSQGGTSVMTMPAVPGGTAQMPSMPNMPSMPAMPQMPNMPNAAPAAGSGSSN